MVVLVTKGSMTASQNVDDRIFHSVYSPSSWIATWEDRGVVPAYVFLRFREDSIVCLFIVQEFVYVFVKYDAFKGVENSV